jgi:hypothetical protein
MTVYQKRVEDTPKREQDLLGLQRDYGNIKEIYNSLLDRKLEAELAVNMEKKQKGEQFRMLDIARLPEKPITPNVLKLLVFSLAGGLGVSGAVIFLLEFFSNVVRRDEEIEKELGLSILASIPQLPRPGDLLKKRAGLVAFGCMGIYVSGLLGCFAFIYLTGIDKVTEMLRQYL